MVAKEIILKDIGRPKNLRIPLPEDGGIVVLSGRNGAGKSTTLEAVQDAITGRKEKKSRPRDGVTAGSLKGCGVTMTVSRKITRSGELTVETLDGGRLSIADLVSPPFKGELEADGRRIKALVQLAGVEASPELFRELHPNFGSMVELESLTTDDILVMADRIKRDFEKAARGAEGLAALEKQHALACEEAAQGIDVSAETDSAKLQARLEAAVRHGQGLISAAQTAKQRNREIADARARMDVAKQKTGGESLDDIREKLSISDSNLTACVSEVSRLRAELAKAEENERHARSDHHHWSDRLLQAEQFADTIAELEQIIGKGEMPVPTDEELNAADAEVTAAREAIEAGATARGAKDKLAKAEDHHERRIAKEVEAESLRQAAAGVDHVLTEQIAKLGCPLRVEAGRLVTDTDRGATFYSELSEGERWKMAVEIAIKAVGPKGLLTIPQEAFESIQSSVRCSIHELARAGGVAILTAEASELPDVVASEFDPDLEMQIAGMRTKDLQGAAK